jgi:hypothetical protein
MTEGDMESSGKHIDVKRISAESLARFEFLSDFVGFTEVDRQLLQQSLAVLGPALPGLLDAIYDHLLSYDDTRRLFLGEQGTLDPAYIELRKEHLTQWLLTMAVEEDLGKLASYIAAVARMHTGAAGQARRKVPPRYVVGLTCFVQTAILKTAFAALPEEPTRALQLGLAWHKLLTIHLELFLKAIAPHWPAWDEVG